MTRLALPDLRLCATWAEAMLEFGEEQVHGSGSWNLPEHVRHDYTRAGCAAYVETLARLAVPRPAEGPDEPSVPSDYYWIVEDEPEGEVVVGFLALRHRLNAWLLDQGGHIGYSVRPSRRRQGHAGRALRLALGRARELGLDRVLVTCDEDNEGSRRTIEGAGGVLEDVRTGKRRYWIDTPARVTPGGSGAAPA